MNSISTIRRCLGDRIREVRIDRFGVDNEGLEAIGEAIGIPAKTWRNYEEGVVIPGEVLLKLIELTRVNTQWLLTGEGSQYLRADPKAKFLPVN